MLIQKNEGFRTFNFAVAPFVGIGDRPKCYFDGKAVNQIFERLDWFLHSKGIKQYKLKFEPQWRDVYVAYQGGPIGLLRLALNVIVFCNNRAGKVKFMFSSFLINKPFCWFAVQIRLARV